MSSVVCPQALSIDRIFRQIQSGETVPLVLCSLCVETKILWISLFKLSSAHFWLITRVRPKYKKVYEANQHLGFTEVP